MSSTSSDTSMHAAAETPRRVPWRFVLVLLLLLAAAADVVLMAPPALRAYRAAQHPDDLAWTGVVAEGAEQILAENPDDAPRLLGELLSQVLHAEAGLAYLRVWDAGGALVCEADAGAPAHPRTRGVLPVQDFPAALRRARRRTATGTAEESVALMLQLIDEQARIAEQIERGLRAGKGTGAHHGLYLRQNDNLILAESLEKQHPALRDAAADMVAALQALTHTDEASLYTAKSHALDAETNLSLALEELRTGQDLLPALPAALAAAMPPAGWHYRLLPHARGRRLTAPLFTFAPEDGSLIAAGAAEVVFFDRTVDLARAAGRRCLPAGGLLLAAILLMLPWRRPRAR